LLGSLADVPLSAAPGTAIGLASFVNDPGTADTFSYAWSITRNGLPFDPGTPLNTPYLRFTPVAEGLYALDLTVTDDDGGTGQDGAALVVTSLPLMATIEGAPTQSLEGTPILLTADVSGPISLDSLSYAWNVTKNGVAFKSGTQPT